MSINRFEPIVHDFPIDSNRDIRDLISRMMTLPHPFVLDGCRDLINHGRLNRYSYLCADPVEKLIVESTRDFDFAELGRLLENYQAEHVDGLPPFQGGAAGLLSYEFNGKLEQIPRPRIDDFRTPLAALFVYDVVVAIDHDLRKGWIISQGWPERQKQKRELRAWKRLEEFLDYLTLLPTDIDFEPTPSRSICPASEMHRLDHSLELYSDLSRDQFLDMVDRAVRYIGDGDVFQVNLSQRLLTPATRSSAQLYLDLRNVNPAPFSGYFEFGNGQVISASPERLVSLNGREIETRPIKGTRKRTRYPEVDLNIGQELIASEKDRAENIMIVDLMRNDLSRASEPESVLVKKLCGIEQFQNVLHLVSVVKGKLKVDCDSIDLLGAVFPGGSITGAPKIRAMEIISELEPTARGPYCGSLGYIGVDGTMDFNILIRTITAKDGWWQIPVGGGIVSDSKPDLEYDETWTKAIGMLRAVTKPSLPKPKRRMAGISK